MPEGKHGVRINESADCKEAFNPFNKKHGGPWNEERKVGGLGNLEADKDGVAHWGHSDPYVKLSGPFSVIGKAISVHEKEDDLGFGRDQGSLTDGNVGKCIAKGII